MTDADRIYKLENGTDTARWAAKRILELEAELKECADTYFTCSKCRPSGMKAHNLRQQSLGVSKAAKYLLTDEYLDFTKWLNDEADKLEQDDG